ncbi:hypothetical protein [Marivirga sp.]|uniref:hypothetical protein n=1 Tax=Marivirga sp. TaxID=2018662 RepID=UPI0025D6A478|nr:hypothetical protein [Marivirga sp.]
MKELKLLLITLITIFSFSSFAQEEKGFEYRNNMQFELGGHGLVYSINYERILINNGSFKTAAQLGISYYPPFIGFRDVWMPIGINEIISFNNHHFKAGLGVIVIREAARHPDNTAADWNWDGFLSGRIGYRYQKPDGRFVFRLGFTPIVETNLFSKYKYNTKLFSDFHPSPAVSIGYGF